MKIIKEAMISVLVLSTIALGACSCAPQNQEQSDPTKQEIMSPTDDFLLAKGASDYKIVCPDNAHSEETFAASELQILFREATNVQLPIVNESDAGSWTENSLFLCIGKTQLAKDKTLVPSDAEYGTSGYIIDTEGKSVFIVGGDTAGTVYGTYKFLEYILGYDYFYPEVYALDKGVADIRLMDYDVSIIPDIEYNVMHYGMNSTRIQRLRYSMQRFPTIAVNGQTGHSSVSGWFPKTKYCNESDTENYHPKWYMLPGSEDTDRVFDGTNVTQLCYTARGDETEYQAMLQTAANTMKEKMIENEEARVFDFSLTDDYNWCNCEECLSLTEKYGEESGVVIRFLNDMTETVEAWFATVEGQPYEREFFVNFYAYYTLVDAPVTEKDGKLSVVDETVLCNKHVVPQLADIEMDYTQSIHDEINLDSKERFEEWAFVSQNMSGYYYSARYNDYLAPLDTFNDMQALYQYSKKLGLIYIYNLGTGGADQEKGFPTGWCALRMYLAAKLGIDTSIGFNAHIDKFFKGAYLDAAEPMRKIFDEWRFTEEYNSKTYPEYVGKNSYFRDIKKEKYFSLGLLERWKELFGDALQAIEYLKTTDPVRYEKTYKMIAGERVWVNYLYYKIYQLQLSTEKLSAVKKELANDIELLGITAMSEMPRKTVESFLKELRG